MRSWRALAAGFVATATLAVGSVTTLNSAVAAVDNPTFVTGEFGPVLRTNAWVLGSVGLTPLTFVPDAHCERGQSQSKSLAAVNVPGVLSASAVNASCAVSADGTTATSRATVGQLSLLGGRIKASLLDARCSRSADGTATVGATWGSLVFDQNYARNGAGAIVIPGIAEISLNERYVLSSLAYAEMVLIHVFPQQIGGVTVVPEHAIAISGCVLDE